MKNSKIFKTIKNIINEAFKTSKKDKKRYKIHRQRTDAQKGKCMYRR